MRYALSEGTLREALGRVLQPHQIVAPVRQVGAGRLSATDAIAYADISDPAEIVWDE